MAANGRRFLAQCDRRLRGPHQAPSKPIRLADERARPAGKREPLGANPLSMTSPSQCFSAPDTWIESAAIDQLRAVASLPGMSRPVGVSDLYPSKGSPIGAAFAVQGRLYPYLVGNDVGCGMGLWTTISRRIASSSTAWPSRMTATANTMAASRPNSPMNASMAARSRLAGDNRGGNHFAELQRFSSIVKPDRIAQLGIHSKCLAILVRSGSRVWASQSCGYISTGITGRSAVRARR
jgi:hypothetical protein